MLSAILLVLAGTTNPLQAGRAHTPTRMDGLNAAMPDQAASAQVESLSAGAYHACAIQSDGSLVCWGAGRTETGLYPEYGQSMPPDGSFIQVSAGAWHNFGLKSDGSLVCWGGGACGGYTPPAGTFRQVSAGSAHTCAIKSDGSLACWGQNDVGQLNNIPAGTFIQVEAGWGHTCGVRSNGRLACWGDNSDGQSSPFRLALPVVLR